MPHTRMRFFQKINTDAEGAEERAGRFYLHY
jgi:hypothetical protein